MEEEMGDGLTPAHSGTPEEWRAFAAALRQYEYDFVHEDTQPELPDPPTRSRAPVPSDRIAAPAFIIQPDSGAGTSPSPLLSRVLALERKFEEKLRELD